jgi:hypothetical protein
MEKIRKEERDYVILFGKIFLILVAIFSNTGNTSGRLG